MTECSAPVHACRSNNGFLECRTDNKRSFPTCTLEIVSVWLLASLSNLYSRSDVTLAEFPNYGFSELSPLDLSGLEHNALVPAHVNKRGQHIAIFKSYKKVQLGYFLLFLRCGYFLSLFLERMAFRELYSFDKIVHCS
jgi:hypothetical protein